MCDFTYVDVRSGTVSYVGVRSGTGSYVGFSPLFSLVTSEEQYTSVITSHVSVSS